MKCNWCHKEKDHVCKAGVYVCKDGKKIQRYKCRDCNSSHVRRYYQRPNGKEATMRAIKKYRENNKLRVKAWELAGYHIARQPCEVCGVDLTHRHHPDPSKPLEVIHLCPLHHTQAHGV